MLNLVNIFHIQVGKYQLCLACLSCDYDEADIVDNRVDQVQLKVKFHVEPMRYQAYQAILFEPAHLHFDNHDSGVDVLKYDHRLVGVVVRSKSQSFEHLYN
ncbi:hypothetical protein D3C72_2190980 [compost metagenome]